MMKHTEEKDQQRILMNKAQVSYSTIYSPKRENVFNNELIHADNIILRKSYLSIAKISIPEALLFPYLKVISSGCFFLDVILTTEFSACRDCI